MRRYGCLYLNRRRHPYCPGAVLPIVAPGGHQGPRYHRYRSSYHHHPPSSKVDSALTEGGLETTQQKPKGWTDGQWPVARLVDSLRRKQRRATSPRHSPRSRTQAVTCLCERLPRRGVPDPEYGRATGPATAVSRSRAALPWGPPEHALERLLLHAFVAMSVIRCGEVSAANDDVAARMWRQYEQQLMLRPVWLTLSRRTRLALQWLQIHRQLRRPLPWRCSHHTPAADP